MKNCTINENKEIECFSPLVEYGNSEKDSFFNKFFQQKEKKQTKRKIFIQNFTFFFGDLGQGDEKYCCEYFTLRQSNNTDTDFFFTFQEPEIELPEKIDLFIIYENKFGTVNVRLICEFDKMYPMDSEIVDFFDNHEEDIAEKINKYLQEKIKANNKIGTKYGYPVKLKKNIEDVNNYLYHNHMYTICDQFETLSIEWSEYKGLLPEKQIAYWLDLDSVVLRMNVLYSTFIKISIELLNSDINDIQFIRTLQSAHRLHIVETIYNLNNFKTECIKDFDKIFEIQRVEKNKQNYLRIEDQVRSQVKELEDERRYRNAQRIEFVLLAITCLGLIGIYSNIVSYVSGMANICDINITTKDTHWFQLDSVIEVAKYDELYIYFFSIVLFLVFLPVLYHKLKDFKK